MISFGPKVDKIIVIFFLIFLPCFGAYVMWRYYNPEYRTDISELSKDPKWKTLAKVGSALDAEEFREKLTTYFTVDDTWKEEITIGENGVLDASSELLYSFGTNTSRTTYWRRKRDMPARSKENPLRGIKIALDPGHIGGKCAQLEERWFVIDDSAPVMEGEMTLLVAQLIKPKLEELGAIVSLTREKNEPVGTRRSPHFKALAKAKVKVLQRDESYIDIYADKMFYRTSEIRSRARIVNKKIQPDMVVALHFNALAWGDDPNKPTLVEDNNFHILLNGAYTSGEVKKADQRYEMIRRILEGTIDEEIALSKTFVNAFKRETKLPPYQYEPNSKRARPVDEEGYVWARNLLANRLYECPTIFLEPYIMNSQEVFDRVQLGDYYGEKEVHGEMRKSIFREYADAVVSALVEYYGE